MCRIGGRPKGRLSSWERAAGAHTARNVKLLLPPRQSRGISYDISTSRCRVDVAYEVYMIGPTNNRSSVSRITLEVNDRFHHQRRQRTVPRRRPANCAKLPVPASDNGGSRPEAVIHGERRGEELRRLETRYPEWNLRAWMRPVKRLAYSNNVNMLSRRRLGDRFPSQRCRNS